MTPALLVVIGIGVASFWGSAYLLSVWHEDRATGTRGWPLSRVIAYLAIAGTLASNYLAGLTIIRLWGVPNYLAIATNLTGLTIVMLLVLLALFPILALYLRTVRATGYMTPTERSGIALESSVQEVRIGVQDAISAAREAYKEANDVNIKIANLTEALGHKEDKPEGVA